MALCLAGAMLATPGAAEALESSPHSDHLAFRDLGDTAGARPIPVGAFYSLGGEVEVLGISDWDWDYHVALWMDHDEVQDQEIRNETVDRSNVSAARSFPASFNFSAGYPGTEAPLKPGQPLHEADYSPDQLGEYIFRLRVALLEDSNGTWSEVPGSPIWATFRLNVTAPERHAETPGSELPVLLTGLLLVAIGSGRGIRQRRR